MKTVWILYGIDWETQDVLGLFHSEADARIAAQVYCDTHNKPHSQYLQFAVECREISLLSEWKPTDRANLAMFETFKVESPKPKTEGA